MDIKITYNGEMGYRVNLRTVYEFFIPARNITFEQFINYKSEKIGKTNAELVYEKLLNLTYFAVFSSDLISEVCSFDDDLGYVLKSFDKVKPSIIRGDMLCPTPCIFYSDSENLNEGIILQSSNLIVNNEDTLSSYNYDNDQILFDKMSENLKRTTNRSNLGVRREESKPLVWIWCKSLCPNGKYIENSIFNLSPFVDSISTTETESGSSFSIDLISIDGVLNNDEDLNSIWTPNKNSYIKTDTEFVFRKIRSKIQKIEKSLDGDFRGTTGDYDRNNKKESNTNTADIDQEVLILSKDQNGEGGDFSSQSTNNLFDNLISSNDVIFISYVSDPAKTFDYIEDFFIDNKEIPNLNWDLIGLVDSVDFSSETETYSQMNTVSGRDLMKLLIEDGSYFFMNSTGSEVPTSVFQNNQLPQQGDVSSINFTNDEVKDKSSMNREYSGLISSLYLPTQRNIGFVMNLLFSKLCNVEICPDELFEPYGEERTKYNIPIITSE